MAANTTPATLSELQTDFIERVRDSTSVTAIQTIAQRYLNIALHDMHISPGANFPWAERRAVLITHDTYTTGTVSITSATSRTAVVGSSTLWNTAVTGFGFNNARVGGKMTFSGLNEIYEVSVVGSDTSVTLATVYTGADLSAASYTYFEDEYALASDFGRPLDHRFFNTNLSIPLIGKMEFRRRYPRNDITSKPKVATLIQLGFSSDTAPRYRIIFYPVPDDEYSIPYTYITTNLAVSSTGTEQAQMTASTDEPIVPLRYRQAIIYHALFHWYRDRKDDSRSQEAKAEYVDFMTRTLGDTVIGQDRPQFVVRRRGRRPRMGRFEYGNRFDEIKDR